MDRKYRQLEPSKAGRPPGESSKAITLAAKRKPVSIACDTCRKQKARCDGARPTCARCRERGIVCAYQPDHTRVARVEVLKVQRDTVLEENTRLWQLFQSLRELPKAEASELLIQLRNTDDPAALLRLARNISPEVSPGPSFIPREENQNNTRLAATDMRALANSPWRVSARPWTLVAGDGVVSELISSFFKWDDAFFAPFIDREAFLADMRSNDPTHARYCSPLLVNAICASRSFTSRAVKTYDAVTGEDIGAKFLNEAKKMYNLENDQALPTVQALAILFTVSSYRGADKQGLAFRFSAYDILDRLDLPRIFRQTDNDPVYGPRAKEILSKALWGLFCFESIVGYVYLQQSLIPPPDIPRCFVDGELSDQRSNSPGGSPSSNASVPLTVSGVLDASCNISLILYRVMGYNATCQDVGSDQDLAKRRQYYNEIQSLWHTLPEPLTAEENFTPQTCFLRIYIDEVIISIWRSVHVDTIIESGRRATANDLLIHCARNDTALSNQYFKTFGAAEYSCMLLCGLYNSVLLLVERLGDPRVHETFVELCIMIRRTAADYPLAGFVLQTVLAMAWAVDVAIPARALPYLQNLNLKTDNPRDIPLTFGIPETVVVRNMLRNEGADPDELREMGKLLAQWLNMTID